MTDSADWTSPGADPPPGWSRRQPPPYGAGPPHPGFGAPPPPPFGQPSPYAQEHKPGVIPLRPLGIGEILDGAIGTLRRNPRATLGLAAIVTGIVAGFRLAAQFAVFSVLGDVPVSGPVAMQDIVTMLGGSIAGIIASVVGFLGQIVLTGMLTVLVGRAVLGRHTGIGDAWRDVRPRLLPLLGLTLVIGVIFLGVLAAVIGPVILLAVAGAPVALPVVAGLVLGLGGLAVGVWLYVMLALSTPALVLERAGVFASLRRSWALVRPGFWRILGILALTLLILIVLSFVLQVPFATPGQLLVVFTADPTAWLFRLGLVLTAIGTVVAGTVTTPFAAGVTVLLYVDQRMRREGLDIVLHETTRDPAGQAGNDVHSPWLASIGGTREGPWQPPAAPQPPPPPPPPGPGGNPGW